MHVELHRKSRNSTSVLKALPGKLDIKRHSPTVLPAKSDSDVKFCLQSYQGLMIDRSLVFQSYPTDRINTQVIDRFTLAQLGCTS